MEHASRHPADWDLSPFFSGATSVESTEYERALEAFARDLESWVAAEPGIDVERLLALEALQSRCSHFQVFLYCESSANTMDAAVKKAFGSFARFEAELEGAVARMSVRLGNMDETVFECLLASHRMEGRRFYVRRYRDRARVSMGEREETLAAELAADGAAAWERLRSATVGPLTFEMGVEGEPVRHIPISQYRMLSDDPDAAVRRAAFQGAGAAWERVSVPCAAALNAMTGARLTLNRRRGVEDVLAPSAVDNFVDVATVEALMAALRERPEALRALLREKAQSLGVDRLHGADLAAPDPAADTEKDTWEEAAARLVDALDRTFPSLAGFARMAIDKRWIDHSPRPNKAAGGFCSTSGELGESRIFMTFGGTMGDSATLAHELGHAHHSWLLRDLPLWSGEYPSTVAETASTFAEAAMAAGVLAAESTSDRLRDALIAERRTQAIEYLANTIIRFDIEREVYRRRAQGEISVQELKEITLEAQRSIYGDTVDHESLSPWLWASVPHFYFTWASFYNYPYTFGSLLSRWIWREVEVRGPGFLTSYESFLRASGTSSAEDAAQKHLGVDLRGRVFWDAALG